MFEAIKLRMYFSKIQAELKAQYNDQAFVNRVCQLPHIMEQLGKIRTNAYYKGQKIAPFLNVCFVLGESMESDLLTQEDRHLCRVAFSQTGEGFVRPSFQIKTHYDFWKFGNQSIRVGCKKCLTIAGIATAFSLRLRLHYKAAHAAGVKFQRRVRCF